MTCSTVKPLASFSRMNLFSSTDPFCISQLQVANGSSPHPPQAHLKFLATAITCASSTLIGLETEADDDGVLEVVCSVKKVVPSLTKMPTRKTIPMTRVIIL